MHGRILHLIAAFLTLVTTPALAQQPKAQFVGSSSCKSCHAAAYQGWKQTRMANVVQDPHQNPKAVLADFTKADPLVNFSLDEIAFVYGSRWKQRFFKKIGDDFYPMSAQWDIAKKRWLPYHVEPNTDWWEPFYGKTNLERPTGPTCDGCHSVNYNLETHQVTEWNVGCEKCHGPGSLHVAHPTKTNIVNPEKLDSVRGNDTCIQCHSQGQPLAQQTPGHAVDWPAGYLPGDRLADFWRLEELKPGTTNFLQFADLTAHKNRMQGNDFVQSNMYHRQLRCFDCHQVHSNDNVSNLKMPAQALCLSCHAPAKDNPAGLTTTVAQHTHHADGTPGSQCVSCHMPKIEITIKENFVSAHTFRFITPSETRLSNVPNACTSCHKDKSNQWAETELRRWTTTSPWRVGQ